MIDPEVFAMAQQSIHERGWWRGPDLVPGDPALEGEAGVDGSVCIAVAVMGACGGPGHVARRHLDFLRFVIGLEFVPGSLADWNDESDRTLREVLAALQLAYVVAGGVVVGAAFGRFVHWASDQLHLLAHFLIHDPEWRARNG